MDMLDGWGGRIIKIRVKPMFWAKIYVPNFFFLKVLMYLYLLKTSTVKILVKNVRYFIVTEFFHFE